MAMHTELQIHKAASGLLQMATNHPEANCLGSSPPSRSGVR